MGSREPGKQFECVRSDLRTGVDHKSQQLHRLAVGNQHLQHVVPSTCSMAKFCDVYNAPKPSLPKNQDENHTVSSGLQIVVGSTT